MIDYKYRAYNTTNKEWLDSKEMIFMGGEWFENYRSFEDFVDISVNSEKIIVTEYSTLQDKNSVEVWEGDIVRNENGKHYEVVKAYGCFGVMDKRRISFHNDETALIFTPLYHVIEELSKVGNIYENPELLEVRE